MLFSKFLKIWVLKCFAYNRVFQVKIEGLQNAYLLCPGFFFSLISENRSFVSKFHEKVEIFRKICLKKFLGFFWAAYSVWIPPNESLDKTTSTFVKRKKNFFFKNYEKIRKLKCLNCDNSRSLWSISNPKTVLKSVDHKLSFETLFGAKFKILKWRILIGRKFFEFFYHFFFFKNIKTDWLSSISL